MEYLKHYLKPKLWLKVHISIISNRWRTQISQEIKTRSPRIIWSFTFIAYVFQIIQWLLILLILLMSMWNSRRWRVTTRREERSGFVERENWRWRFEGVRETNTACVEWDVSKKNRSHCFLLQNDDVLFLFVSLTLLCDHETVLFRQCFVLGFG